MSTNGDDAAFARPYSMSERDHHYDTPGLTKREHIAALALQGMLANGVSDGHLAEYARRAVLVADYLIRELNRAPSNNSQGVRDDADSN